MYVETGSKACYYEKLWLFTTEHMFELWILKNVFGLVAVFEQKKIKVLEEFLEFLSLRPVELRLLVTKLDVLSEARLSLSAAAGEASEKKVESLHFLKN